MTNKELVTGFFMEGYVHHNYDFLMEHMAVDYFDHSPCAARSNQECVDALKKTEKIFTDMEINILDLIEEDNKVVIRARFTATHRASFYDVQPTGKRISFEALEIFRIENDLIVESWGYWPDMSIRDLLI